MKREIPRRGPTPSGTARFSSPAGRGKPPGITPWTITRFTTIYRTTRWPGHAGDKEKEDGGNLCGIGVELCVNEDGNFESTFENGARLTARLLQIHHLELSAVKQHGDFIEKNCPQTIRDTADGRNFWGECPTIWSRAKAETPANAETMRGAAVRGRQLLF